MVNRRQKPLYKTSLARKLIENLNIEDRNQT